MGVGCTRPEERALASLGMLENAATVFEQNNDINHGGLLCALPALSENGLFRSTSERLPTLKGYYSTLHILLVMAYMALARLKNPERLSHEAPGEFGKLLGLDRIPEARCLRKKLTMLSDDGQGGVWQECLSKEWLAAPTTLSGLMYIDGHVQVYHGKQSKLPRKYLSRERLCMHGISNYWVNDIYGQPVFVIPKTVNPGLIEMLRSEIVPRLLSEIPNQPTPAVLAADPYLPRFIIIFDREGYSPEFFKEMWEEHRVSCISYHKHPGSDWDLCEFEKVTVEMPRGEEVELTLAERGTFIGSSQSPLLWVRETRKLTKSGHQTSIISTAYDSLSWRDAGLLFARWSQENFFCYMMEHYDIDRLSEYGVCDFSDTMKVINPTWRELKRQLSSVQQKLRNRQAKMGVFMLPEGDFEMTDCNASIALLEEIDYLLYDIEQLKEKIKDTDHYMEWGRLPEAEKFHQLLPDKKRLVDTIKMICYRAETALSNILQEKLSHTQESRALARELFTTPADLRPDLAKQELHVLLHHLSNPRNEAAVEHLLKELNSAEFIYPGTNLKLRYAFT